jgi:hypothetical protein
MESASPINAFQKLVRRWDRLHPYNAAQIFHLRGAPDASALNEAWQRTLTELRIGSPNQLRTLDEPLENWITAQMNLRFEASEGSPFRPFVLGQSGSYFLGIVYHHWVADSASIRLLMREWFFRVFDPGRARGAPVSIARGGYWRHFGPAAARWDFGLALLKSMRWSNHLRHARRVESKQFNDFTMRFSVHRFADGAIDGIRAAARRTGATVNDWFLAAIAQVCAESVVAPPSRRRSDLALGTIVDLRARSRNTLGDAFGLFLGFTNVILRPRELEDFPTLVATIARQTRLHKTESVAESSMIRIAAGIVADKLYGHDRGKIVNFYRKRLPLAGGISNVNLNGTWPEEYHPDPLIEYIRVSPTGPMMPVVFTTTTLGNSLNFGLTTRDSIVPAEKAQQMAERFKAIVQENAR